MAAAMAVLDHAASVQSVPPQSGDALWGCAASGGTWEGVALVVESHWDVQDIEPGAVLVVGTGSSTFSMLAPLASAVIAEGGGVLSHVAIVCREYRIPCVSSCSGALKRIRSGQRVLVDGTRGVVELLG
jgi:pyruvate,water dikinase